MHALIASRVFLSSVIGACAVILCGCFPVDPPDTFPIRLTVVGQDHDLALVQCNGIGLSLSEISVNATAVPWGTGKNQAATLMDARSNGDDLVWEDGLLVLGEDMSPLRTQVNNRLSTIQMATKSDVYVSILTDEHAGQSLFKQVDLSRLQPGEYIATNGEVYFERC